MKIFIAQLVTETNTFAPNPTGWENFEEHGIFRGDASSRDPKGRGAYFAELRRLAEADGHEIVESVCTFAQPAGRTNRVVYESLRDEILAALRASMPVDAVVLILHGAMVADGYEDCEGDLLSCVREIVGPRIAIGAGLDLHCHFTTQMRVSANVIICFKEYPHIDGLDRTREVYRLTLDTALGRISPVTASYDCRMVGLWHTTAEPMKSFVRRMQDLEGKDGILSISLGHGFPWGDVPDNGAKVWVVANGDLAAAAALAERLGREFWKMREATQAATLSVDAALDIALEEEKGPVVLADVADNPGGGAPGDSTFILRRLVERGINNAATGIYWDPGAIAVCKEAGIGSVLELRIGGKCGPMSGDPVDLRVTVREIVENHTQNVFGTRGRLGRSVWIETDTGLDLVLVSVRSQVYGTDAFTGMGIDLARKKMIVAKSTQHFHASYSRIAGKILYVTTPGAVSPDFANIPYRRRDLNYWPRVPDPFAR